MKCPKCGFQQGRQPRCKRCGWPLETEVQTRGRDRAPWAAPATDNPYAPPAAFSSASWMPGGGGPGAEIFRDGDLIVARDGASFPDRCVRCNESAEGFRVKKTFYWHAPSWYLLILLSILIYAVVAMVVRRKASFELALCPLHRRRRRLLIAAGLGVPLLTFFIVLLTEGDPMSIALLMIGVLLGAVVGIIGAQILTPKRIEDGYAYLKGARPEFLASLPVLPFH